MKLTLLSASLGAILGHFIEIYLLVSSQQPFNDDMLLVSEGTVSPLIFALPFVTAIIAAGIGALVVALQRIFAPVAIA